MVKKKIIFVEPKGNSNVFSKFMTIPLLGPIYLATIAKKAGYEVQIINENVIGRSVSMEELVEADILGLSCLTTTVERGKIIARDYKAVRSARNLNSHTIIGGIHASMMPDDVAPYFDQVVIGEAENVILDVLSGKLSDKIVKGIPVSNLDALPYPDFKLLKNHKKMAKIPLMTSRGCPYDCNFCSVTEMFGRGYRVQSPERVMQDVVKYPDKSIFFVDDHFAVDRKRTELLLDLIIRSGRTNSLSTQLRTEVAKHPLLIAKMRKAGIDTVYMGFESINPESLKILNKKQSVYDIRVAIRTFHKYRIRVHGMFMFGSDSDTIDVFKATLDFCKEEDLDYAQYAVLTPLPGTKTYAQLESEGRLIHKDWNMYDGLHAVFRPKHMTAAQLQQGMIYCFSRFYSIRSGIKYLVRDSFINMMIALTAIYRRASYRSMYPALMKFMGKGIVKRWLKENKSYIKYLDKFSKFQLPKISNKNTQLS